MAIIQDVSRDGNQGARFAGSFRDGQFTRYIEIVDRVIVVSDSDKNPDGSLVVRHRNYDLTAPDYQSFVPTGVTMTKSGIDSKAIFTFGGFTADTRNSRRVTVKTDLVVREPWERYEEMQAFSQPASLLTTPRALSATALDSPTGYKTASGKTIRKVQFSSTAAAVAAILTLLLNMYVFKNSPLPDWFETALSLAISGILTGASALVAGYVARPRRGDTVVPDRGQPPPLESSIG